MHLSVFLFYFSHTMLIILISNNLVSNNEAHFTLPPISCMSQDFYGRNGDEDIDRVIDQNN